MFDAEATVRALNWKEDFYLGMHKFKEDVLRYEKVIKASSPELIIECGTDSGDSTSWFSQFADVVTIDIRHDYSGTEGNIIWLAGSSVDASIFSQVQKMAHGKRVMVSLDSDHSYEHVLAEMKLYNHLVQPGGYMVVEDGIVRQWWGQSGPLDAIEEFLPENPQWILDTEINDMFPITGSPGGWLKRVE